MRILCVASDELSPVSHLKSTKGPKLYDVIANTFPERGWVTRSQACLYLKISKSTWYAGIGLGRYPSANYGLGRRSPRWRAEEIRSLLENRADGVRAARDED